MASFQPFRGVFYDDPEADADDGAVDISSVLENPNSEFAVHRLSESPGLLADWLACGRLRADTEPALYMYRAGRHDGRGGSTQVCGVFGLVEGLKAGRTSLPNAIVEIEPAFVPIADPAFDELLVPTGVPVVVATSAAGVHYRLWALRQRGVVATISDAVELARASTLELPRGLVVAATSDATPPPGLVFFTAPGH